MKRLATFVLSIAVAAPLAAWGPVGHRVVAAVAEAQLSSPAKAKLKTINGNAQLVPLATTADAIRNDRPETKEWHFVDIPVAEETYDAARDCKDDDCVVARIEEFRGVLADGGASKAKRKEALMFLVHFVGDVHQPMHSSDNNDRGGNDVKLKFGGKNSNLHSIWDSGIIQNTAGTESKLVKRIKQRIADGDDDAAGDAEAWANETHGLGQDAYKQVVKGLGGDGKISNDELKTDGKVVEDQLLRAGVRLAKLINEALQ
jgi:hypothetical protein